MKPEEIKRSIFSANMVQYMRKFTLHPTTGQKIAMTYHKGRALQSGALDVDFARRIFDNIERHLTAREHDTGTGSDETQMPS